MANLISKNATLSFWTHCKLIKCFFLETRVNFCRSWVIRILGLCWGIYQLRSGDYIVKSTILNFWMFCIVSHFCHSATTSNFRGFLDWIVRLIIALYPVSCIIQIHKYKFKKAKHSCPNSHPQESGFLMRKDGEGCFFLGCPSWPDFHLKFWRREQTRHLFRLLDDKVWLVSK